MTEAPSGKTLEDLTRLVQMRMNALGLSHVRFAIRPLPFELRNWCIETQSSVEEELRALHIVAGELGEKYFLLLKDVVSPYAA